MNYVRLKGTRCTYDVDDPRVLAVCVLIDEIQMKAIGRDGTQLSGYRLTRSWCLFAKLPSGN